MKLIYSLDDLVMDDSFIAYCLEPNAENTVEWQQYLIQFPKESETLSEACRIVLLLHEMMGTKRFEIEEVNEIETSSTGVARVLIFYKIAAVLIVTGSLLFVGMRYYNSKTAHNGVSVENRIFHSEPGQMKKIVLPDSTMVTLNVSSELEIDKEYGMTNRNVRLNGEAFFDVTHDQKRPFILQAKNFNVKVLGTRFNVKAYAGNEPAEATLIKGSIELSMDAGKRKFRLQPNEKAIVTYATLPAQDSSATVRILKLVEHSSNVSETAWIEGKLVAFNHKFSEIQPWLERLYDVKIIFRDEDAKNLSFTGTFERSKISVKEILESWQLSGKKFLFEINNKTIYIKKVKG